MKLNLCNCIPNLRIKKHRFLEFERERDFVGASTDTGVSPVTCFLQEIRFNIGIIGPGLMSSPGSVPAQIGAAELSTHVFSGAVNIQGVVMFVE